MIAPMILCAREGFQPLEIVALILFAVLITAIACWFCSTFAGLIVLLTGREQDDMDFAPYPPLPTRRTALLMPLYNEDAREALAPMGKVAQVCDSIDSLVAAVVKAAKPGDLVLCMSNGGFGGVHGKLLDALDRRAA
eukprot:gene60775-81044_t